MQRNFAYIHKDGCGMPGFYLRRKPCAWQSLADIQVELAHHGRRYPEQGMPCSTCGKVLNGDDGCLDRSYIEALH